MIPARCSPAARRLCGREGYRCQHHASTSSSTFTTWSRLRETQGPTSRAIDSCQRERHGRSHNFFQSADHLLEPMVNWVASTYPSAMEIVQQANDCGLKIADIVHGTGSSGTQAGLVAGLEIMRADISVPGISVRARAEPQIDNVHALDAATAERIAPGAQVRRDRVGWTIASSARATACRPRAWSTRSSWRHARKDYCSTQSAAAR